MAIRSISETKRVRYLLGLSSPAEREQIESDYFANEDAFQEMLTAEDDLIDAYARGELAGEERRRFEKSFVSSLHGRERVPFARALASTVSDTRSVETQLPHPLLDIFRIFQSPGLLRTATIGTMIVLVVVLAWLLVDRRRMSNELRELRTQSAELSNRSKALQGSDDTERTRTAEIAAQLSDLRAQSDKPRHPRRGTGTQRAQYKPEGKNVREEFVRIVRDKPEAFEIIITDRPIQGRGEVNLLTLQPATSSDRHVAGGRADQANLTLDGVELLETLPLIPRNTIGSGVTTVRGTVKDPTGNVVSGATVTLTDPARNLTRTQSTNKDGTYGFNAVTPGTYSLEVAAPGFKIASASGLAARVDTPTVWDVGLEVGAVSETLNVTAAAGDTINSSDASVGNSFRSQRITELPLNANNIESLLSLQPSVNRTGFVNDARADQLNITFDGVDATIRISSSLSWIRFEIPLETAATHEDYRVTIKTADGRPVTSVDWSEPLTPNQTTIDPPAISTDNLTSDDYVLLLMGKEPDGSFVKVAEYSFKLIKY